jgi:general stress protein YciG
MSKKLRRGFACMDREKRRIIASKGGRAAHEKGSAHEFTSEEAREAGRKGGHVAHENGTAHRFSSEQARAAGRKGGQWSRARISLHAQPAERQLEVEAFLQESESQPHIPQASGSPAFVAAAKAAHGSSRSAAV